MPTNADPEINPAHIGSHPSTHVSWRGLPASAPRPFHQNNIAPSHIASVASGGNTTPSPMATADNGNRPFVRTRSTSNTTAKTAAAVIATNADAGNCPNPRPIRSATPFH